MWNWFLSTEQAHVDKYVPVLWLDAMNRLALVCGADSAYAPTGNALPSNWTPKDLHVGCAGAATAADTTKAVHREKRKRRIAGARLLTAAPPLAEQDSLQKKQQAEMKEGQTASYKQTVITA